MKEQFPARTVLQQGQSVHMHAEAGMTVVAVRGAVDVRGAPEWIGEQIVQARLFLQEGEAHVLQSGGWIALSTPQGAEVACLRKESWFWRWLERLPAPGLRRLTRVIGRT